jgi:hypothetical protein
MNDITKIQKPRFLLLPNCESIKSRADGIETPKELWDFLSYESTYDECNFGNEPSFIDIIRNVIIRIRGKHLDLDIPSVPVGDDIVLYKQWCQDAEKCWYKSESSKNKKEGEAGGEMQQTSEINKSKGGLTMVTEKASKENWEKIKSEYECSKLELAKKINFVKDDFKRKIILRDVEHAFVLASHGFAKPAVILAGGVIEELLKEYLRHKKVQPKGDRFTDYIKACENNRLLKLGVSRLGDAIRDFRNLVHISGEKSRRHTITMATAKGAVSSIFTIANDFQ